MLMFMHKKVFKDDRLLQLMLLFSLLRGDPNSRLPYQHRTMLTSTERSLGSVMGHSMRRFEQLDYPHHKSIAHDIDYYRRSLLLNEYSQLQLEDDYQRRILEDLHELGRISGDNPFHHINYLQLNSETVENTGSNLVETRQNSSFPFNIEDFDVSDECVPPDDALMDEAASNDLMEELGEDYELIEALWKQDIDLGIPRDLYEDDLSDCEMENEAIKPDKCLLDLQFLKEKDPIKEPDGSSVLDLAEDKPWYGLNFTVDSETGELLAANASDRNQTDPSINLNSSPTEHLQSQNFSLDFNLDDALNLAVFDQQNEETSPEKPKELSDENNSEETSSSTAKSDQEASSSGDLQDALNASIDDMLQTTPYHHRNAQGRLGGLARSGSMEPAQRGWPDIASLLSLPSPETHHAQSPPAPSMASHGTSPIQSHSHLPQPIHHPHPIYPGNDTPAGSGPPGVSRGVFLHNVSLHSPHMPEHSSHSITYSNSMGASSHLVTSSMNLTNNGDMAVALDPHYKMEASNVTPDMIYYQQNSSHEISHPNDGIWPSMSSMSILNEDELQLMDITMPDYNNRTNSDYVGSNFRYSSQEDLHRQPQKKHHLYGKRYFHDNATGGGGHNMSQESSPLTTVDVPVAASYQPHYPSTPGIRPLENPSSIDPELKYSCTMDFTSPEVPGHTALDHVHHNHTYHSSGDHSSNLTRTVREKKGKRTEAEKHLTRDEKKAHSLNLPITCEEIINLPMDEFNEKISKFDLSEAQLSLIRDIRRRGKNKVAAQNCRKRKLDQIVHLAEEVKVIQYRKTELRSQHEHLSQERERVKHKFSLLYRHIFQSLRDQDGNPYSPHEFSLQQSADGSILLVPRSVNHHSIDHKSRTKEEPS